MLKLNYFIVVTAILSQYLLSCTNKIVTDELTVFSGKIENNATNEIRIENRDTIYKSSVESNGFFKIKFRLKNENFFTYVGNEFTTIHLSPGDSLFMSVDARTWREFDKTLIYSGKGSDKNNYFFHRSLLIDELVNSKKDELFSMNENEFLLVLDSACAVLNRNYKVFIKENPHDSYKRLQLESQSIKYLRKDIIIQYYLFNQKNNTDIEKITTIVDEIIAGFDLNNMNHSLLDSYNQLIIEYFRFKLHENKITDKDEKLIFAIDRIDNSIENDEIKTSAMQFFIKNWITNSDLSESSLAKIKLQLNSDLFDKFESIFNKEKPLTVNAKAPEFHLYDKDGNEYTLSNYTGNYIYIDVWASYCGPCLKEAPYFEQLKKDFQEENISFISISLDRKESNWLNTIEKYKMSRYQLRPINDWSSDFVNDYSINHYGIPHYIIIDPKGNIIKMPAPKPSKAAEYLKQII